MADESRAQEIRNYSFLVVFANDAIIDAGELRFLEKLALEDRKVDPAEREALRRIFERVRPESLAPSVAEEIARFRARYAI